MVCECILLLSEGDRCSRPFAVTVDLLHISVSERVSVVCQTPKRVAVSRSAGAVQTLWERVDAPCCSGLPWVCLRAMPRPALSTQAHAARPRRARHFWHVVRASVYPGVEPWSSPTFAAPSTAPACGSISIRAAAATASGPDGPTASVVAAWSLCIPRAGRWLGVPPAGVSLREQRSPSPPCTVLVGVDAVLEILSLAVAASAAHLPPAAR